MSKLNPIENFPDDDYYLTKMKEILEGYPKLGPLQHPSKLIEHVYIGNQDNADNLELLQALEITHVLNVAGTRTFDLTRSPYRPETGIVGFLMMPAEDYEEFDIMQYFMDAAIFLDKVKAAGGRALVHCNIGVNRSGAIVAAYLMVYQKRPLLKVIDDLKSKRSLILQNVGFRRQLIRFARCRGLLDIPDLPPKKAHMSVNGYTTNGSRGAKIASNQDRSNDKSLSNGTSNAAEEATKEPEEATTKENNGANHFSKETTGDVTQNLGSLDERKPLIAIVKYAGYENDLGNFDLNRERSDKTDKSYNKISYLDLGNLDEKRDKLSGKKFFLDLAVSPVLKPPSLRIENLLSNESAALLPSSNSYYTDYPFSSRRNRNVDDDRLLSNKLLALSLELPRARVPSLAQSAYGNVQHLPSEFSVRDYYPSLRAAALDRLSPASSLSQHISRDSSLSDMSNSIHASLEDEDLGGRRRPVFAPVSSCYFENNSFPRDYPSSSMRTVPTKSFSAADKFISIVKPMSYYQKLVSPVPLNALDDFDAEENGFGFVRSHSQIRPYSGGKGMLFVPHMASSKSSPSLRNGLSIDDFYQPKSYADLSYSASYNTYVRNDAHNRNSLSALDSLSAYDFPQRTSTGGYYPYRPRSNYRNVFEYDDALDEYSNLLDASRGKSNTISATARSRVRMGPVSGFRKSYKY